MAETQGDKSTISTAKEAKGEWMNEANIVATSYPYVEVRLGNTPVYIIPYNQLKEVVIEGKTALSRKGSVKFVDAIGEWPDILMKIGADSNKIQNVKKPNITLTFGWKKLRGNYECLRSLDGMIIKSAIDLTEDGQVMISLEYIETATNTINSLRYLDPNDIKIIYDRRLKGNPKFTDMLVSEKLKWLTDHNNNTTICKALKENNIKFTFEDTNDDKDVDINIGFGDYLVDVINELTSKAKKKKSDSEKVNYSYERSPCQYEQKDKNNITVIPYVWKPAPDESNTNPTSTFDKMKKGPTLVYKKTASAGEKQILSFTSDLSSKTSLMMQAQDELNKKLMAFSQEDMDMINELFQKKGTDGLNKEIKAGWLASSDKVDEANQRNERRLDMIKIVKAANGEVTNNQNSQLNAILANNVFKSNVKIIGDPTFGTDFEPWKISMETNFTAVGGFGKTFGNRKWALTYVRHVFGEGSYETEMEMLTYPQPDDKPAEPSADYGEPT